MTSKRSYTPEFRLNAVHLIVNEHRRPTEVAAELGIPVKTLNHWCYRHKHGQLPEQVDISSSLTPEQMENSRLKAELQRAKAEIALLKKFTAYLTKNGLA